MPLPALLIPAITTGLSVSGNIFSQKRAAREARKRERFLEQRRNDLASQFNRDYYTNYLDTDAARASLNQMQKNMKEASSVLANKAVQGGATPEAVIAQQGMLQDKYQNALNDLTQIGEQKKQADKARYMAMSYALDNQKDGMLQNLS